MQQVLDVSNEVAAELAGVEDGVLDALRERLHCTIALRGNRLTLGGDDEHVAAARAVVVTPNARSFPLRMCSTVEGMKSNVTCTCPPKRSASAGALPR